MSRDACNARIDEMRSRQYPSCQGQVYLDRGGTTVYAKELVDRMATDLISNLFGNPHSDSAPSAYSSHRVEEVRKKVLNYLGADEQNFDVIFTANATAAIKLVMESFRDLAATHSSKAPRLGQYWYGYHLDAHTSLIGVRETTNGRHTCFTNDKEVEDWLHGEYVSEELKMASTAEGRLGLFAYPGQSNMTGRRLPLDWCRRLRASRRGHSVYSLLDASALCTTSSPDLSDPAAAPDFTCLSFYKIFGLPDLVALVVRKDSGHILQWRKYFGGGTVDMIMVMQEPWVARKDFLTDDHYSLHDQLEDGTLPFHNIITLGHAIDLYDGLASLKYPNGTPVCRIYKGSLATYGDPKTQGATIAFNLQRDDESIVSYSEVERYANDKGIYLLSGGLCNPGGIASHLHLAPWEFKRAYSAGHRCGHVTQIISGKPTGVVRASLGAMSTLGDVNALLSFMRNQYLLHTDVPVEEAPIVANDGQKAEDPKLVMLENAKTRERPISKDTIDSSITAIGDTSHQFPKRKSARFKTWFSPWLFRIRRHKAVNQSAG